MILYEAYLSKRIAQLRTAQGASARDMSLSIGQSESYINKIENRKTLPSMQVFFYICEYFKISPKEFFDDGLRNPVRTQAIIKDLNALSDKQIEDVHEIIKGLKR